MQVRLLGPLRKILPSEFAQRAGPNCHSRSYLQPTDCRSPEVRHLRQRRLATIHGYDAVLPEAVVENAERDEAASGRRDRIDAREGDGFGSFRLAHS
jgi:hypothetical protein